MYGKEIELENEVGRSRSEREGIEVRVYVGETVWVVKGGERKVKRWGKKKVKKIIFKISKRHVIA